MGTDVKDFVQLAAIRGIVTATVKEHKIMIDEGSPYEVRYKVLRQALGLMAASLEIEQ